MKLTIKLSLIYFKEQILNAFNGVNKKAKSKTLPFIILLFSFLSLAIGYSLYNIASTLKSLNMAHEILIIGLFMAMFLTLMLTLSDTQGVMYKSKDYDMLMSLPLRTSSIISAKYIGSYLTSMLYYVIIAIPTFVVYFIFVGVSAFSIIFVLLSVIFMPAFSQFLNSTLGFLINALTSKMKNKNIVRTIFTLICGIGLALFISFSNTELMNKLFAGGIPLWFKIVFSNIYFLFVAINSSSFVYFLYALLVSVAFMVLGILVIMIGYRKINTALLTTKIKGKPAPITYNPKNIYRNLLKKEYTTFFNSPVYCVNGLMGPIMSIVCTIILITTLSQIGNTPEVSNVFAIIMPCCVAICLGIAPTTSVSFSIEGLKLQLLKSLPIKFKDLIISKCLLNFTLSIPVLVLCVILFGAIVKLPFLLCLLILFYLLFSTVSQTALGLLLNLRFPRINWSSETQAVKNGTSMLLTMFLDLIIAFLPMILFFILLAFNTMLSPYIIISVFVALQIIYDITLISLLFTKGEKLYNKIQV